MNEYTFILAPNYSAYQDFLREHGLFERTNIYLDDETRMYGYRPIRIICLPGWDCLKDNHRILAFARYRGAEILEISERREIVR